MNWKLIELEPGPALNRELWPTDLDTFIPVPERFIRTAKSIPKKDILVLGKTEAELKFPLLWKHAGRTVSNLKMEEWLDWLQQEEYRQPHRCPLTARLPFHYHHIPGPIRNLAAAWLLNRKKKGNKRYPVSLLNSGVELLRFLRAEDKKISTPRVVFTHDIDTASGFRLVEKICAEEKKYGFTSSWNIVPRSYPIPHDLLQSIKKKGFELGLHGIWHTNLEPFLSARELKSEFEKLRPLIETYEMKGFRSPSWFRTPRLFDVLAEYFRYDSSTLDSDTICPGGPGGVGVTRPFLIRPNLVELPCTLPYEAPLFFGKKSDDLLFYWLPKINFLKQAGGVLLVNTHPDSNYLGQSGVLESYFQLLDFLKNDNWTSVLPSKLAAEIHA